MEILLVDQAVLVDQQPEVYDQGAKDCTGKQQRFFSVVRCRVRSNKFLRNLENSLALLDQGAKLSYPS
jgi:hypothetical protein